MLAIGNGRNVWEKIKFGGGEKENAYSSGPRADLGIVNDLNKLSRAGVGREDSIVSI